MEKKIFHSSLAMNGQVTLKKEMREQMGIETGDEVYFQVLKIVAPDGVTK